MVLHLDDICEGERAVEMGEEGAAAGWLPFQWAERFGIEGEGDKAFDAGEPFGGGGLGLLGRAEVDVAIGDIGRRAFEQALLLKLRPFLRAQQLDDWLHERRPF